ncbi:Hypothetical predicted protein [Mytilus galloprovincialis]|uniref:Uncharacterized protein n=2 Tax=Mytilus galloprovincialis TaxID=29158 RepID=A0A8B6CVC8_MYTGA|nr:Hypothetical predicted protein [Mytilus galloprovincialis]
MTNVNNSNTSASGLSHQNILQYNPDSSYLSIVNPSLQYAQQMQSFQPFQQTPHQQMVQPPFCSTPNMVHPPPNSSPSMMSQRPVWVDELFTNMRHIETRLDKLDQIGILVSSMNMKVIQVEQETKSLSERLAAVEISTQYVSDQYEDQKTKCNELKSSVINIEKTINTQHSDVSSVEKKNDSTEKEIEQSFEKMKNLNEKMREDLLDTQIKSNIENLVFYNIPEKDDEDCLEESLIFCEKNLKMPNMRESIQILKANRMGNKGERIRPILVKFGSFKQREEVRKNGKNLKDTNFGISEQLPGEIQKRRKTLLPELKKLRDEGHKAYFVRDKIHVGGKEYKK